MFVKSLTISSHTELIREIQFHNGINLIVDETPSKKGTETGNNVGKTTVLMLIDFCLGASPKQIYTDPENKKEEYRLVKEFLIKEKVLITLTLKEDLSNEDSPKICIERNFLPRNQKIQRINGVNHTDDEFDEALTNILFPGHYGKKPTFRQIISHNIRYKDLSINNTLKILDAYTRDSEYETLYLFLLGCDFEQGDTKQELLTSIRLEQAFKKRLEKEQTKSAYETALALLEEEIAVLNRRKSNFNLNENFESDLDTLNNIRYQINMASSEIGKLTIRHELIAEAKQDLEKSVSKIDLQQLEQIYRQATEQVSGIQKTFADLCSFHNQMIDAKVRYIAKDLPRLETDIKSKKGSLNRLLQEEAELSAAISRNESFEELEKLISELNEAHRKKGDYENTVHQLVEVDENLGSLNQRLNNIDDALFSSEFEQKIKEQKDKFNKHFASISQTLYGEQYALKVDPTVNTKGQRLYKFSAFNTNFSSGKKQGEISCFDIAYTLFADEENIPCFHFLLNDKKELMHDNQLLKISNLVNSEGIQFVASILKDKLPEELNREEYIVLKLSQTDKLFRIGD
ncbi:DUF2326 domain-containing protein [Myxococcota bacterium]|nr:DUF2326 domain-containing protein [Myxococcota bacterium]MBU1537650.1 DUF2326 domain-containing protein [Myxococcota bacterium]